MRRLCLAAVIAIAAGCGRSGQVIYPPPPGEPGTDPPPEVTGVACGGPATNCEVVSPGSGDAAKSFALVTVRITVDDLTGPPSRVGPRQVSFLHPVLGTFPFRGRDRDLTPGMISDRASSAIAGPAFFEKNADVWAGVWTVGMRRGGARRVHGLFAGPFNGVDLPAGHERSILIELLDFCYPIIRLGSQLHWSWLDGSGSPVRIEPSVSVSGCGAG